MDSSGMNIANSLAKINNDIYTVRNKVRVVHTLVNDFIGGQGFDEEPEEINVANEQIDKIDSMLEDMALAISKVVHEVLKP